MGKELSSQTAFFENIPTAQGDVVQIFQFTVCTEKKIRVIIQKPTKGPTLHYSSSDKVLHFAADDIFTLMSIYSLY